MCLLEVAMCEKYRRSHFQSEGGPKSLKTVGDQKSLRQGGFLLLGEGGQYPITCHVTDAISITSFFQLKSISQSGKDMFW